MNINELLKIYKNECPFFDMTRFFNAKNGDILSIVDIGTDFAKARMFLRAGCVLILALVKAQCQI